MGAIPKSRFLHAKPPHQSGSRKAVDTFKNAAWLTPAGPVGVPAEAGTYNDDLSCCQGAVASQWRRGTRMLATRLVQRGDIAAAHQSDKPLPTNHFWITPAISALFLSCISMWEFPLMPISGRLIQSTVPPAALMALAYSVSIFLNAAHRGCSST